MFKRKSSKGPKSLQSSPSKEKPNNEKGGFLSSSLPKNIFSGRKNRKSSSSSKDNSMSPTHNANTSPSHTNISDAQPPDYSPYRYIMHDGYSTQPRMPASGGKYNFESPPGSHGNIGNLSDRYEFEQSPMLIGDQSLDRQFARLAMPVHNDPSKQLIGRDWHTLSSSFNRDKSIDKEYPHMGARSLERDHNNHIGRSRSSERPEYTNSNQVYNSQEIRTFRDGLILELQSQIADLNKDCAKMQQEVDSYKDKLSSSMNSIKTFWSPELKKERALRKEENAKYCLMNEQLKVAQAELKKQSDNLHELENQTKSYEDVQASSKISQQEIEILQREKDKQNKEILILKKTVDEMELRIETQKQTLSARDESMKKLLEMLQSKGLSVQKIEDNQQEVEHLQTRQLEDDRKIKQLQNTISQNELEISKVKEENSKLSDELKHSKLQLKQQPSSTHTMQAILEAKDSRISALEKEVQSLEDRLMTLQEEGNIHYDRKDKDAVSSSREKTLKAELDLYKKETSRKDKELLGLTLKKETLENQQTEHQQYIHLLKEQITAKDEQVVMLQSDLEDLRDRVKDKDSTIDRKAQKSQSLQSEKRKIETEVSELKEQLEIKDRRISNLQTQINSLESAVNEKETELRDATTKLESHDSDDKIQLLEESLSEKDKQIDRLKEQKNQSEREHQEELDVYSKASQDIKTRLDSLQLEFNAKQTELVDLREHSAEAQSVKFEADSKIRQLESSLDDKTSEVEKLNVRIEELKSAIPETKAAEELQKQTSDLSSQVETARNEANKAQEEVDRLLGIVKETENEKNEKENQIKELQELMKEYKQKVGTLKRKQSMEKKNSATMLEEARKREDSLYDDATKLEDHMKSKNDRIEELEEALKESVKITAEREMVMVDLQTQLEEAERKVDEYTMDLVKAKSENSGKVEKMTKIMEDKDIKLKKLHAERHKHLEEVFEMKQEAILAAMSEKDANIALLEMTSSKKQNYKEEIEKLNNDKEKLQQQLSDVTHNRMKLIQKQERREERKKSSLPRKKRESPLEAPESQPEQEQPPMTEQTDS
ncbi:ELKS/Rab6-interacting/CAST family member 1-like isoform X5 [Mytilus galloprovincialis]|uniref:ELKS/Rab6-interacting/CAST family member 1-like isoform X5 n=1 Tax=Mytilus galloprovincialis TaxID=29158 RepID=UPI003F7BB9A8